MAGCDIENEDIFPDASFGAAEDARIAGISHLAVHWAEKLVAFTDGRNVAICHVPGSAPSRSPGAAPRLLDMEVPEGTRVSAISWNSKSPAFLCVAYKSVLKVFKVLRAQDSLDIRRTCTWEANNQGWRELMWLPDSCRVVAAMAPKALHVYGVDYPDEPLAVDIAPASSGTFSSFKWMSSNPPQLVVGLESEVWLWSWQSTTKSGRWQSFKQRTILLGEGAPLRCLAATDDKELLLATFDMPVSLNKELLLDEAASPPSPEPALPEEEMPILKAPTAASPSVVLSTASASSKVPSIFLLQPPACAPQHAQTPARLRVIRIAGTRDSPSKGALPTTDNADDHSLQGLPMPDILCVQGVLVVVGSSFAPHAPLHTFTLHRTGLTPMRRLHWALGPLGATPDTFVKGISLATCEPRVSEGKKLCLLLGTRKKNTSTVFMSKIEAEYSLQVAVFELSAKNPTSSLAQHHHGTRAQTTSNPRAEAGATPIFSNQTAQLLETKPNESSDNVKSLQSVERMLEGIGVVRGSTLAMNASAKPSPSHSPSSSSFSSPSRTEENSSCRAPARPVLENMGPTKTGPWRNPKPDEESSRSSPSTTNVFFQAVKQENPKGSSVEQQLATLAKGLEALQARVVDGLAYLENAVEAQGNRITTVEAACFRLQQESR